LAAPRAAGGQHLAAALALHALAKAVRLLAMAGAGAKRALHGPQPRWVRGEPFLKGRGRLRGGDPNVKGGRPIPARPRRPAARSSGPTPRLGGSPRRSPLRFDPREHRFVPFASRSGASPCSLGASGRSRTGDGAFTPMRVLGPPIRRARRPSEL